MKLELESKATDMQIEDHGAEVTAMMTRQEFFLVVSLMSEAFETGDDRDFETRVGASKDEVRALLQSLPDLPLDGVVNPDESL